MIVVTLHHQDRKPSGQVSTHYTSPLHLPILIILAKWPCVIIFNRTVTEVALLQLLQLLYLAAHYSRTVLFRHRIPVGLRRATVQPNLILFIRLCMKPTLRCLRAEFSRFRKFRKKGGKLHFPKSTTVNSQDRIRGVAAANL